MDRTPALDHVLMLLRARASELRLRGVLHVSVFGSVARRAERAVSDVDLLVDLAPEVANDLLAYAGIAADLEDIVGRRVDVAQRTRLRPHVRPAAESQAVRAF
jgi:predicted nucleotidyltransferase